jgi:hypothetical protein
VPPAGDPFAQRLEVKTLVAIALIDDAVGIGHQAKLPMRL